VKELAILTLKRVENPIMLIDWIYNLTEDGKRFKQAALVVHAQADKVMFRK